MPADLDPHCDAVADDAPHVLVVDDDRRIRDLLSCFLVAEGYRITTAVSAADARVKLQGLRFDLIILDVTMPGETGFSLARDLRSSSNIPIIMLTARSETQSRIEGLTIGADDYLPKPFEPKELSLRIGNILRRTRQAPAPAGPVLFGDFSFHAGRGELKRGNEIVRITEREREMLRLLAAKPGETVPRLALAGDQVGAIGERAVDVQVNRLRRKIENDSTNPRYVQTVRGVGYRLVTSR